MNAINIRKGHKGAIAIPVEERFWAKVHKRGPDECWPWTGSCHKSGRGQIFKDGANRYAPRVSWEIHHGRDFPEGKYACHSCDNPNCVNPNHIWPGSAKDNVLDAHEKGLVKSAASLSRDQVLEIYALRGVVSQSKLAARFGVSPGQVSRIHTGDCWSRTTGHRRARKACEAKP